MALFVLSVVLLLVIGGCVCIVWAERGGPRWVRVVAAVTRGAGELLHIAGGGGKKSRSGSEQYDGD